MLSCPGAQLSVSQFSWCPVVLVPNYPGAQLSWCPVVLVPSCTGAQLSWCSVVRFPIVRCPVVRCPVVQCPVVLVPNHAGAQLSWCPIVLVPSCLGAQFSWCPVVLCPVVCKPCSLLVYRISMILSFITPKKYFTKSGLFSLGHPIHQWLLNLSEASNPTSVMQACTE